MIRSRRVVGGLVAALLVVGGVFGVLAASSGASRPVARPAAAGPLGSLRALGWRVQTPVGARLVLRPSVSFHLPSQALRRLRARKPRLRGLFVARIVTAPARGRSRTLVVMSRRANRLALGTSAVHSILGKQLGLPRWVLSRRQTAAVKRAAARGRLAVAFSARYSVSYTNARGRTVVTGTRSQRTSLRLALKRQTARGADLRKLATEFRALLGRAGQLKIACVTRNTIVEQLRNTYGVMVSGDRSSAAGLLQIYADDAGTMQTAGMLNGAQSTMLASGLVALLKRVGSGHSKRVESPRRWPALRSCGPVRAHRAQTLIAIIVKRVAKRVHKVIKKLRRHVQHEIKDQIKDKLVDEIKDNLWPQDTTQPSVNDEVPTVDTTQAEQALDNIKANVDNFTNTEELYLATNPAEVASKWDVALQTFANNRWRFEPNSAYYSLDYQLALLPLLAEDINLYLSVLREGVLNGPRWGMTLDGTLSAEDKIRAELNPNSSSSGCGSYTCAGGNAIAYTKKTYDAGLARLGSPTDFAKTNEYIRDNQIGVLDSMDMWHLQDPMGYPFGDPNLKQNRIIYTDAVGSTTQTLSPPANPSSPLSALTAWTAPYNNRNWLTAIQTDNSPQVGARTGAAGGTPTSYTVTPDTVVQVDTTEDQMGSKKVAGSVQFHFSDGGLGVPGGAFYDRGSPYTTAWEFQDEVLAAAKIMGSYKYNTSTPAVGDAVVFGFRLADSFSPTWKGSLPGARRAPGIQACLGVEQATITSGTHIGATTGSRANGAQLQMRNCASTSWDQTWQYIDYDDPNDPNDNAAQQELTVYGGTMCMAPKTNANGNWATGGGFPTTSSTTWPPPAHTLVAVYDCNGTDATQKWTLNTDGTIRPANATNLCLDRWNGATASGTLIQLYTCSPGNTAQTWTRP